ncbi:hypothetical protein V6N12_064416 [Hibiscus sabdariffa]|uniref:HTH myb-type domain-containing protein n=1 Tax=Hibiscus sabdariffa TaxID=183260 RepID=A0ABR2G6S5_9ROSI
MRKPNPSMKCGNGSDGSTNKHKKGLWSPEENVKLIGYKLSNGQAARLFGRTDNEVKNFWNSTIRKRLKHFSSTKSASEHNKDAMVGTGFMLMLEQEVYPTYMDLSSNSLLQSMVPNHARSPLPVLEHD